MAKEKQEKMDERYLVIADDGFCKHEQPIFVDEADNFVRIVASLERAVEEIVFALEKNCALHFMVMKQGEEFMHYMSYPNRDNSCINFDNYPLHNHVPDEVKNLEDKLHFMIKRHPVMIMMEDEKRKRLELKCQKREEIELAEFERLKKKFGTD